YLKKPFDSQELLEIVEQLASSGTAPAAADFAPAPPAPLPFPVFPGAAAQTTPASPVAPEAPAASAPVFPETSFVFSEPFPEAASAEPPARAAEPIWSNFEIEPDAVTLPPLDESDLGLRVEPEAMFELAPEADEPLPVFSPFESAPEPAPSDAAPPVPEATPAPAAAPPATPEPAVPSVGEMDFAAEPIAAPEPPRCAAGFAPAPPEPAFPSFGEMDFSAEPIAAPEPPRFAAGFAPAPPPPAAAPVAAAPAAPAPSGSVTLSDDDVDRIARRVVELLGDKPVRDVAWEVIPDLAEVVIRDRIRELEAAAEA